MPGHDEETVRKSRHDGPDELATTDPDAFGRMAGGQVAPDDPATEVDETAETGDRTDEDLLENR